MNNEVSNEPMDFGAEFARDVQEEDHREKAKISIKPGAVCPDMTETNVTSQIKTFVAKNNRNIEINPTLDDLPDTSQLEVASKLGEYGWDQDAKHIHKLNRWLYWDDTHWVIDEKLHHVSVARDFIKQEADDLVSVAHQMVIKKDDPLVKKAKREANIMKSSPFIMNVVNLARSNPASMAGSDEFDSDLYLLGTPGGTADLRTGEMLIPKREHMITKQTGVAPEQGEPVLWLKFLNTIFNGDQKLIQFIQVLCGYSLTGSVDEEKLFFLYGKGANGKSVLIDNMFYIMGDYVRRAPSSIFLEQRNEQHSTGLAGLHGARLAVGSELPAGKAWDEAAIRDMTGGDVITARLMRQNNFDFKPQFTLMIAGNHQPRIKSIDEATIRRMVMIPFNVTIPPDQRDTKLTHKLKAEAGQILNWSIQGVVDYCNSGLKLPQAVKTVLSENCIDSDLI